VTADNPHTAKYWNSQIIRLRLSKEVNLQNENEI